MADVLRIRDPEAGVRLATLDSPPVNAIGGELRRRLLSMIDEVEHDPQIRCLVLTGSGETFCAGADLHEEESLSQQDAAAFFGDFGRILDGLQTLRIPVIAAVNGPCLGAGLELALMCDIRLASSRASFTASGVNVGLVASCHSLSQVLGAGPAASMLLTGLPCDAERALRFGLTTEVYEPDRLLPEALRQARRIASRAPLAVEATKRCLRRAPELTREQALLLQGRESIALSKTADHKEAIRAYFERRPSRFARR